MESGPHLNLRLFGGAIADHEVVMFLGVLDDRLIKIVSADADRLAGDDPPERDDRYLRGAAADIDDHAAGRLFHRKAGADRRSHRLLHQIGLAGRLPRGIEHSPLLHLSNPGRDADDHHRAKHGTPRAGHIDKIVDHRLCVVKISDDTVLQGTKSNDVAGSAADHMLRLFTHGQNCSRIPADSNYRGFP